MHNTNYTDETCLAVTGTISAMESAVFTAFELGFLEFKE